VRGRPITILTSVLLDAAKDVFLDRGTSATTAEIARRAGTSESVLFHRFKTKDEVFLAVLKRQLEPSKTFDDLQSRVGKGEIEQHLFELAEGVREGFRKAMPFFLLARTANWKLDEMHKKLRLPHPAIEATRRLSGYFEAEIRLGRLRPVDPEILARAFMAGVTQYILAQHWLNAIESLPLAFPTYARGLIDLLLHGAAVPSSPLRKK
jgi:AcrR family transcriptional regulator